jgi:adenylate kinase family enzyme
VTASDHQGPPGGGLFVLVAGWPGSGKSTLAAALASRLGLPLLAKDEIKEAGLGPVIQVDTSGEVDISQLVEKLNQVRRE